MANEAASVAAEEAPPTASESGLPDPPQLPKTDSAQKSMKEPAKPQTPVASMDSNKGTSPQKYKNSDTMQYLLIKQFAQGPKLTLATHQIQVDFPFTCHMASIYCKKKKNHAVNSSKFSV